MSTVSIIVMTAACFAAVVLNLAMEHRFRNRVMGACMAAAVISGVLFYGYGFAFQYGLSPLALIRALLAVCRMFGGANDLGAIEAAPLFEYQWALTVFWIVHFMAFYVTASAAIGIVGGKMLRRIRMMLLRRGTLLLIFGVNAGSVEYGRTQIAKRQRSAVFVDESADVSLEASVHAMGAVLEKGMPALDAAFLRRMGLFPGKRRIEIAALHADGAQNMAFARELLSAMEKAGIHPEQTSLVIKDAEEEQARVLQAEAQAYGYGSVFAFDEYELCARLMIHSIPPCEMIAFDDAKAVQDFSVVMIGFGKMGRAALEQLIMNGQFAGSAFRADIFDAGAQKGMLYEHEILRAYDIRFHADSGKSDALYAFLSERLNDVRCIVLCTGSDKENREIAQDLGRWLRAHGASPAMIQMSKQGIVFSHAAQHETQQLRIYDSGMLDVERIDRMAMVINQMYCGNGTAKQNWMCCDYFSRMSSRASADFYPAMLRASGKTMEQVEAGDWPPHAGMLENLAMTEHLRWCAFHYVMGFRPMTDEEFKGRAEIYRAQVRDKEPSRLRIGKDMEGRQHACLIDWEKLDALSEKENAITGGRVDYKQMDRNNVLALSQVLKELRSFDEAYKGGKTA